MPRIGGGRVGGVIVVGGNNSDPALDPAYLNRAIIGLSAIAVLYVILQASKDKSIKQQWPVFVSSVCGLVYSIITEIVLLGDSPSTSTYGISMTAIGGSTLSLAFYLFAWAVAFRSLLRVSTRGASRHGAYLGIFWIMFILILGQVQACILMVSVYAYAIIGLVALYCGWLLVALFYVLTYSHYKQIEKVGTFLVYGTLLSLQPLVGTIVANVLIESSTAVTVLNFIFNNLFIIFALYIAIPLASVWGPRPDVPETIAEHPPTEEKIVSADNV